MKSIGIVICNYNKWSETVKCVKTVLESTIQDFTIYIVDNGSTDNSIHYLRENLGEDIVLLENDCNLGSAGGYNSGIKRVLLEGHDYVMLLDNDTLLDENALANMRDYLIHHPEVGIVGAKLYQRHNPKLIQSFGYEIDFEHFTLKNYYSDLIDSDTYPNIINCNAIPTTCVMLPVSVVNSVGYLSEDYFFGWDDIDWTYRIYKAGYTITALACAKAIHHMSAYYKKSSTSHLYYQWRNAISFFIKHTTEINWSSMTQIILQTLHQSLYECTYRKEENMIATILRAYHDATYQKLGEIHHSILLENDENNSHFSSFVKELKGIFLDKNDEWVLPILQAENPSLIVVSSKEIADCTIKTCDNIFLQQSFSSDAILIDKRLNIITSNDDILFAHQYKRAVEHFVFMHQKEFISHLKEMRSPLYY